ncbi:hypothetical protein GCM10023169_34100 [Georgenia halophila]|uniref:histidine kinase n=1 Tax=Georgenia halophila TaxID=620889 RepID=A0ABP8LLI6_9MICO
MRERLRRVRLALAARPELADRIVCLTYLTIAAFMTGAYLVPTVIWYTHPPGSPTALLVALVSAVTGVLGTIALWWRRRRPVLVVGVMTALAIAALAVTGAPGATLVGLALALYALAAGWPPAPTWPTVVAAVTAITVTLMSLLSLDAFDVVAGLSQFGTAPDHPPGSWPTSTWTGHDRARLASDASRVLDSTMAAVLQLGAVAIGLGVRSRRQTRAALASQARAHAREREQGILMARVSERTSIAREVHDVVAHSISVMVALSDGAAVVAARSPEQAQTAMREASETGRAALADMQRVLSALEEPVPDPSDRTADLTALVSRFRTAGLPVTASGLDVEAPGPVVLATQRIVAEALTNALRHAPDAGRVLLRIARTRDAVEIEVLDDGAGQAAASAVDRTSGSGRGLIGIHERAAILGGRAEVGPMAAGGWRVAVRLPVDRSAEQRRREGQ